MQSELLYRSSRALRFKKARATRKYLLSIRRSKLKRAYTKDIINLDSIILHLPGSLSTDDNCPRSSHTNDTLEMSQTPRDVYRVISPLTSSSSRATSIIFNTPPSVSGGVQSRTLADITNRFNLPKQPISVGHTTPPTVTKVNRKRRMDAIFERRARHSHTVDNGQLAWSTLYGEDDCCDQPPKSHNSHSNNHGNSAAGPTFIEERVNKTRSSKHPKFSLCCMQGKVVLPPSKKPPKFLKNLISKKDSRSAHFMKEIRNYNNMFAFTSMGGKIDHTVNQSKGPDVFRLHGQNMHLLGSLLPCDGERPKFSLLYIYDTDNEVSNCAHNVRTVKARCRSYNANNLRLKLIWKHQSDARTYNLPTASEVAALIVGDFDMEKGERDIIVENRSGHLQRIDELHPLYLLMQYPLLFSYGEDGYREDILFRDDSISDSRKQRYLTLR
ncbi:uncharacterized protein G2W53_010522 [Senna tora]|uniref:Helitron helicase-like domain-containing protein n=1 Tax=Senna tora TaxID=362788 RepID=A0A834X165_9FABA|nr:uncharacterized protein G2W53_010522 [Senna tora]